MQTNSSLISDLPAPIAGYFASRSSDPAAVSRWFSDAAIVADEQKEHRGRAAIDAWNIAANTKYTFATEVLGAESDAAHTTVLARVTGNFPGGSVELSFQFTLAGQLISRLEIRP